MGNRKQKTKKTNFFKKIDVFKIFPEKLYIFLLILKKVCFQFIKFSQKQKT